jgi:hypothetical protein
MVGLIPPAPMSRLQHLAGRVALAVALMLVAATTAQADKRVALVLGVSNYQSVARLANPDNDAAAISDVFKRMGFDIVELRRDLGVIEMRRAVRDFAAVAADSDMAVVYYAGHGIEVNGANFLIPADARLQSDFDVEDEAVPLDRILQAINPAKRLRLVILDACRDNPFAERMTRSVATRSMNRGLAKIEPATADTLIAFAAKAGAVAGDGDGRSPSSTDRSAAIPWRWCRKLPQRSIRTRSPSGTTNLQRRSAQGRHGPRFSAFTVAAPTLRLLMRPSTS